MTAPVWGRGGADHQVMDSGGEKIGSLFFPAVPPPPGT